MRLLEVKDLSIENLKTHTKIIDSISFELDSDQCLGIVGESGSGKSMTSKAILGLTDPWLKVTGSVKFKNIDLIGSDKNAIGRVRGKQICTILQDAMSAFDPLYTIGYQMIETLTENRNISNREARKISIMALERLCIDNASRVMKKYPHQLSGGMLQRCMIAAALVMEPDIIIADEPTTSLDSINQRQVVEIFKQLRQTTDTAIIFISHDLAVIQQLSQNILVMKDGRRVEYGNAHKIFKNPENDYIRYLIDMRLKLSEPFSKSMSSNISEDDTNVC
ncbi:ABC transporter ATP-binding protein [Clostridium tyrobutyricum]|uniref:ABC transporter ATP-binding protein n=1 Tax=Clostridium tyrobutyricum TaxID=1519 RepID=UPI0011C8D9F3|nr:ABC transporter ATP-binding protein [Clostridium tyrobutyricum]